MYIMKKTKSNTHNKDKCRGYVGVKYDSIKKGIYLQENSLLNRNDSRVFIKLW